MHEETLKTTSPDGREVELPLTRVHTLVIGSGAAGLNAAVQLRGQGIDDVLILTEGLERGTSINTGSDKQTYYKLAMCGDQADAPRTMAEAYFGGGGMHGDLALIEASLSARAFCHLVELGVPFPYDAYGQFVGYKTDHDPRQRATSIGPYTSREMCRALIREVRRQGTPVREGRVAVELLCIGEGQQKRAAGALAVGPEGKLEAYRAENVVFAVGGPGGLYRTSVYPPVHTGAIGLALAAGAEARNLPDSQFGLASTGFRWNLSGTFMQVIPRFLSVDAEGREPPRAFLRPYFDSPGEMNSLIFLKGYQWPFDAGKLVGGSSLIDLLVYIETVIRGRRVMLDFRTDGEGFRFEDLSREAFEYLQRCGALQQTPVERLRAINPAALELYAEHGIDMAAEPLPAAVCAQHNNGGLAGSVWWESTNVEHLFPVGEVSGSHGVYRPGGSALNAGQVGGIRAAERIAHRYQHGQPAEEPFRAAAGRAAADVLAWLGRSTGAERSWQAEREELQARMSQAGAHIRAEDELARAVEDAWQQHRRVTERGCRHEPSEIIAALQNRQLVFAQAVYLDALLFAVRSGVGSRGSSVVLDPQGIRVHPRLDDRWRIQPEEPAFREKVLETVVRGPAEVEHRWVDRRPIPEPDSWFETVWSRFREGEIYGP